MTIIEIQALSNGAHRNQSASELQLPDGWAVIPDDLEIPDTFPFVDIETEEIDGVQTVSSLTAGEVPETEEEEEMISLEDTLLDLAAEQEERICMLELEA